MPTLEEVRARLRAQYGGDEKRLAKAEEPEPEEGKNREGEEFPDVLDVLSHPESVSVILPVSPDSTLQADVPQPLLTQSFKDKLAAHGSRPLADVMETLKTDEDDEDSEEKPRAIDVAAVRKLRAETRKKRSQEFKTASIRDRQMLRQSLQAKAQAKYHLRYDPIRSGRIEDVILGFGRYKGEAVSKLALGVEGRSYLRWVLSEDFPDELHKTIEEVLERLGFKA